MKHKSMRIREHVNNYTRIRVFQIHGFISLNVNFTWMCVKALPRTNLKITFVKLIFTFLKERIVSGLHVYRFCVHGISSSNVRNAPGMTGKYIPYIYLYIYRSSHRDRSDSAVDLGMRNRLFRTGRIRSFYITMCNIIHRTFSRPLHYRAVCVRTRTLCIV